MKSRTLFIMSFSIFLMFLVQPSWSQDTEDRDAFRKPRNKRLMFQFSDQDLLLPITSIEWGSPDRWSFTSRYVHMFEKDRDNKIWLNNFCATLSPGISGGRLAIGYNCIFSPSSVPHFSLLSEIRAVILRTWGNPLYADTDQTFAGAEIRFSPGGWLNVGFGYFKPISDSNKSRKNIYEMHFGVGI